MLQALGAMHLGINTAGASLKKGRSRERKAPAPSQHPPSIIKLVGKFYDLVLKEGRVVWTGGGGKGIGETIGLVDKSDLS